MSSTALPASSAAPSSVRPGSARAWLLACRPATLTAAIVPVLVGSAVAHAVGRFRLGPALAALVGAILIQIATNFANDVFDHEKGADTEERLGPTRVTSSGLLTPRQVRAGMLVTIGLLLLPGLYLVSVGGFPIVAIGIASVLSGIAYTGGPYPLGYHGLGDVFVFVFFGLVAVCGTVFVQAGAVPSLAWLASVPVGAIATAVLVVNNVRDRETDVKAGKRTLAVRLGKRGGIAEYALLMVASYATPLVAMLGLGQSAWVLLPLASLPLGVRLTLALAKLEGRPLNKILAQTAMLLLVYGALFSLGLVLGAR
jgi:1,4-dihydroxy-2-naphthoate octaprenyltransferase